MPNRLKTTNLPKIFSKNFGKFLIKYPRWDCFEEGSPTRLFSIDFSKIPALDLETPPSGFYLVILFLVAHIR